MRADKNTLSWLLDSDPSLKWQVERDLISAPAQVWQATRDKTVTEGFGAKLLSLQDDDGQWAGGVGTNSLPHATGFHPSRSIEDEQEMNTGFGRFAISASQQGKQQGSSHVLHSPQAQLQPRQSQD